MEAIGKLHAFFIHFPMLLFTAALLADVLHYFGKLKTLTIGHWLVIIGVVMCIPTIITGVAAANGYASSDFFLERHRMLGYTTGICGSLYAGLRISYMIWKLPLQPFHFVFLSLLLIALVSWTGDYGSLILAKK